MSSTAGKSRRALDGDRPHFCFFKTEPFSSPFPYKFRLLDFFFDTEYYAILMSNPFTLLHFRTLARPLQFLIYSYLNVFDNNNSAPSFHEQLPAIVTRSGFGWMFSHISTGSLQVKTIQIYRYYALLSARSIPSVNHTSCVDSIVFISISRKIEFIDSPRGHHLATIPLTRSQNDPGLEIAE